MNILDATEQGLRLVFTGDTALWQIIGVSLRVSLLALLLSAPVCVAAGFWLAMTEFRGRRSLVIAVQSLQAFPTVVVGLMLYLLLSRHGPLGSWGILFTENAMIIGQAIIAAPVLVAASLAAIQAADPRVHETALSLGATRLRAALTTLREVRFGVMGGLFNAFGRVISEVGCAMMVGGNIAGETRTLPTAIALETQKGDFAQGIAQGLVLMGFAFGINFLFAILLQGRGGQR